MSTVQAGGPVEQAGEVYLGARDDARANSGFWLRWRYRSLTRKRDQLDVVGLATLRAVGDELEHRGLDLPEVSE